MVARSEHQPAATWQTRTGCAPSAAQIAELAGNPYPAEAFHRGDYHRLRAGPYRVVYIIEDDLVTIERVDRIS